LQDINWVPADTVAGAVVDLIHTEGKLPISLNISHPRPIPWKDMMQFFSRAFAEEGYHEISIVPWSEWMEELTTYQRLGLTQGLVRCQLNI
jgi:hypothetical protein